jgi:hypothetical protein
VIEVSYDVGDGVVTVVARDVAASTTATVRRSEDFEILAHIPIGTRSGDALTMLVDNTPVDLRPGPSRLTRGSYEVTAVHKGIIYRLDRVWGLSSGSTTSSRLTRDGVRRGTFTRFTDGEIRVEWESGIEVTTTDAAIGYALAGAFGTGAESTAWLIIEALFALAPQSQRSSHGLPRTAIRPSGVAGGGRASGCRRRPGCVGDARRRSIP